MSEIDNTNADGESTSLRNIFLNIEDLELRGRKLILDATELYLAANNMEMVKKILTIIRSRRRGAPKKILGEEVSSQLLEVGLVLQRNPGMTLNSAVSIVAENEICKRYSIEAKTLRSRWNQLFKEAGLTGAYAAKRIHAVEAAKKSTNS